MTPLKTLTAGLAGAMIVGGCAFAQTPATKSPAQTPMTATPAPDADTAAWTRCKTLTHATMMKDADCMRLANTRADKVKTPAPGQMEPSLHKPAAPEPPR